MHALALGLLVAGFSASLEDSVQSLEQEVLAARRALATGHLRLTSHRTSSKAENWIEYEIWFDENRLRIDMKQWPDGADRDEPLQFHMKNVRTPEFVADADVLTRSTEGSQIAVTVLRNDGTGRIRVLTNDVRMPVLSFPVEIAPSR